MRLRIIYIYNSFIHKVEKLKKTKQNERINGRNFFFTLYDDKSGRTDPIVGSFFFSLLYSLYVSEFDV